MTGKDKAVKNELMMPQDYKEWVKSITARYRQCQIKAAVSVNRELISFYWSLGRDIVEREAEKTYGSGFYDKLSKDLKAVFEGNSGFSSRNLRYTARFFRLYSAPANLPQVVAKSDEMGNDPNLPQAVADSEGSNLPQLVGKLDYEELFTVPWGHHRLIIDRCKEDGTKASFFVRKTIQNNWSRAVLENFLDTDLYERQGKAITNFEYALPAPQSDLAQEMTKDPYNFDFLTIREDYDEKQLKDALVDNVIKFLLELGRGFAFVGKEYPLPIEGTEERIDLLFYHLWLHCYVVVEVKIKAFSSRDISQTATYVAIADDLIRKEGDNKTIGLIICKSKNNVLAKYAVGTSKEPIGVSEYELSKLLPTPEEIEKELLGGNES